MEPSEPVRTPAALTLGRHGVGMMIVALANPMIYRVSDQSTTWFLTWAPAIAFAAICYGLFLLFFTTRAKAAWPQSAIILAWVLLGLLIAGNWMSYHRATQSVAAPRAAPPVVSMAPPLPSPPGNVFDAFDEQPAGNPTPLSAITHSDAYLADVKAARELLRVGKLRGFKATLLGESPTSITPHPKAVADSLEASQLWWRNGAVITVLMRNNTAVEVSGFQFTFIDSTCASKSPALVGYAKLPYRIGPEQQAAVDIESPDFVRSSQKVNCLTIVSAW